MSSRLVILASGVHIASGPIVKGENRILAFAKIELGMIVERGSNNWKI